MISKRKAKSNNRRTKAVQVPTDTKENFVSSVQQTFVDKGLALNQRVTAAPPLRARVDEKNAVLNETAQSNELSESIASFRGKAEQIGQSLNQQAEAIGILNAAIKRAAEDTKKNAQSQTTQDYRRNLNLIESARTIRSAMEGKMAGGKVTGDVMGRKGGDVRQNQLAKNVNLIAKNVTISSAGSISLLGNEKFRGSGTDKDDTKKHLKHGDSHSGGESGSALLKGMFATLAGGALLKYILSDEQEEMLKKEISDILSGAVTKSIASAKEALVEHTSAAIYGISGMVGGTGTAISKMLSYAAKGVKSVESAANMASKIIPSLKASGAASSSIRKASGAVKVGGKVLGKVAAPIGAAFDFSERRASGQSMGKAAFGATSGMIGGVLGATGAAALASPTVVGAIPAGIAGGVAGQWAGGKLADKAYDSVFGGSVPTMPELGKSAKGGFDSTMTKQQMSDFSFSYLKRNADLTDEQAAGIVGNIKKETGNFSSLHNPMDRKDDGTPMGPSKGIVQWNGARLKAFENRYGVSPDKAPLETQLEYLVHELKTDRKNGYDKLKQTKTAGEAAVVFRDNYERPALSQRVGNERQEYAQNYLNSAKSRGVLNTATATKANALITAPKTENRVIAQTATPLKEMQGAAEQASQPIVIAPQTTNINTSNATSSGGGGSAKQSITTIRDATNSLIRNIDKHTGFNFSR